MRKIPTSRAPDCMVQKYIGSAFDEVQAVADNIEDIKDVHDNLDNINKVADSVDDIVEDLETIKDIIDSLENYQVAEEIILQPNQQIVTLKTITASLGIVSISGQLVDGTDLTNKDFTILDSHTIKLNRTYPAGTVVRVFQAITKEDDDSLKVIATHATTPRKLSDRFAEVYNFKDFGAVGDGITNDEPAIRKAIEVANQYKIPLVGDAACTYKLIGSEIIEIKTSIDWRGATVDVSEWEGAFQIRRRKQKISYNVGHPVVDAINSGTDIEKFKSAIPAWQDKPELHDSFVLITTNIDQYQYRGDYQKWREFNTVTSYGVLTSPLKYGLKAGSVVSVQVWPMEDAWSYFSNVTFDLKDFDVNRTQFIDVETSLFRMDNVKFKDNQQVHNLWNNVVINFNNCAEIIVDGMYFQSTGITNEGTGSNYLFNFNNSYNGVFKNCKGTGDGWGTTANYDPHRVTYDTCKLSRIDFHRPLREYCKILNCDIGQWGITASTLGDIIIRDTNFYVDGGYKHVNSTGLVRGREDTSGLCDGELLVERCSVYLGRNRYMLSVAESMNINYPAESPVYPVTFHKITYRDITSYGYRLDLSINHTSTLVGNAKRTETCPLIVIDNCKNVSFKQGLKNAKPYGGDVSLNTPEQGDYLNRVNFRVIADKVEWRGDNEFSSLEIIDESLNRFNVDLVVSNSHLGENQGVYRGGMVSNLSFTGRASYSNCTVGWFDFTGFSSHRLTVSINGGKVRKCNLYPDGLFKNKLEQFSVYMTGVQVTGNEDTAKDVLKCYLSNIQWNIRNKATSLDNYVIGVTSSGTLALPAGLNTNNVYTQRINYSGVNYRLDLRLPVNDNSATVLDVSAITGGTTSIKYTRLGDTLTVVASSNIDLSNLRELSRIN